MHIWVDRNHAIWGKVDNVDILDLSGVELENFINKTDFEKIEFSMEEGVWLPKIIAHCDKHVLDHPELY
jgi:hypothetical protein